MLRSLLALCLSLATPLGAAEMVTYTTDQPFDDVIFGIENAIIDEGLLAENTSHVGEMLARTRDDVGSDIVLFEAAEVFSFCSAALSRKVMEANPMNIGFCPYDIFVMQLPDSENVTVGFRSFPDGPMQEVQDLLDQIIRNALGKD
jgi:uncharacterized protein (DUF302 family)